MACLPGVRASCLLIHFSFPLPFYMSFKWRELMIHLEQGCSFWERQLSSPQGGSWATFSSKCETHNAAEMDSESLRTFSIIKVSVPSNSRSWPLDFWFYLEDFFLMDHFEGIVWNSEKIFNIFKVVFKIRFDYILHEDVSKSSNYRANERI